MFIKFPAGLPRLRHVKWQIHEWLNASGFVTYEGSRKSLGDNGNWGKSAEPSVQNKISLFVFTVGVGVEGSQAFPPPSHSLVSYPIFWVLLVVQVIKKAVSQFLQLHRGSPFMKLTPHSESRQQLMRDYLLAVAGHTPHHKLQLVQFTVICCLNHHYLSHGFAIYIMTECWKRNKI